MRGWPETRRGTIALRAVCVAQVLINLVLTVPTILWYGIHETPGIIRDWRIPLLTLWRGKAGPYRGIYW